ncbi:MAG: xanthine dehydrogenase family protein molybdopterin-binding subunit, partial [Pseudomonadota bacterium]|nr:xanthine dehydrogenase family protein molybdopterin-binding subunit [Pseudomonadota bacterium]
MGIRITGSESGIGAAVQRKEDGRFMRRLGRYVADIDLPGMLEVCFARSPVAHARIGAIEGPPCAKDRIFRAADLAGVKPVHAESTLGGFKAAAYPALASGKVRFVGEPVVMCVADSRAAAEDLEQEALIEYEDLDAVTTVEAASA